jgi:hypothetical protein
VISHPFSPQQLTLHAILCFPIQTNGTLGFVRKQQHKAELPPDAKATAAAAVPTPPLPSPGATSSASSSSSSVFSSLRSLSKNTLLLTGAGTLSLLGAGALFFYSLGGNADGGGENTKKRSNWEVESPFFNRITEQTEFNKGFNSEPGVITVLLGPLDCGKTVRSASFFFFFSDF